MSWGNRMYFPPKTEFSALVCKPKNNIARNFFSFYLNVFFQCEFVFFNVCFSSNY